MLLASLELRHLGAYFLYTFIRRVVLGSTGMFGEVDVHKIFPSHSREGRNGFGSLLR